MAPADLGGATNLSCESETHFVRDGRSFADADAKGWRVEGFVSVLGDETDDNFTDLFATGRERGGEAVTPRGKRYCFLTTGTGSVDKKSSLMWQKIKLPEVTGDQKLILEIAYNYVSQEAPTFIGSAYNDIFYVKFDEEPDFMVKENVNDNAPHWKEFCKTIGNVNDSLEAIPANHKDSTPTCPDSATKAFLMQIGPQYKEIDVTNFAGKEKTLQIGIADAGDFIYDSAVLIDHIQFVVK